MESLANRVFAVTGASRGLGLRIARTLLAEGADVALISRPSAELEAVAQELPQALTVPCDVSSAESVRVAFSRIGARFGRLDGLVNNAAVCLLHSLEEMSDEDIRLEVDTNLIGPLYCMRAALPLLRAAGGGDIINISSEAVGTPAPFLTLYGATKAGLECLSTGLRQELQADRIRVTILRSGRVLESSINKRWPPERRDRFRAATADRPHPMHAVGAVRPETMAKMAIQILRLPREAAVELIQVRGT